MSDDRVVETIPVVVPHVHDAVVDREVVLHDAAAEVSHVLNPSAALIWSMVDGHRDVRAIVEALGKHTDLDQSLLDREVRATLDALMDLGVVAMSDSAAAAAQATREPVAEIAEGFAEEATPEQVVWLRTFGPVRACGIDLTVQTNDTSTADGLDVVLRRLPPSPADSSPRVGPPPTVLSVVDAGQGLYRRYRILVDGQRRWWTSEADAVVGQAVAEINQLVIDRSAGHVRFHAGAVERDGRVVMIAGTSGLGKSTLTAALVQRGFRYLTDEVAAVAPTSLALLPYPKALDLGEDSLQLLGLDAPDGQGDRGTTKSRVPVDLLGEVSTGGELALVVLLASPDAAPPALERSPAVQVLLDLVATAFNVSLGDQAALDAVAQIGATVPVMRVGRLPLGEACRLVEAEFESTER